jgi:hypothetical protein
VEVDDIERVVSEPSDVVGRLIVGEEATAVRRALADLPLLQRSPSSWRISRG